MHILECDKTSKILLLVFAWIKDIRKVNKNASSDDLNNFVQRTLNQ